MTDIKPEMKVLYLRMPTSLKKRIKKAAEEAGLSVTAWLTKALEQALLVSFERSKDTTHDRWFRKGERG